MECHPEGNLGYSSADSICNLMMRWGKDITTDGFTQQGQDELGSSSDTDDTLGPHLLFLE